MKKFFEKFKQEAGFTLIEMLIVIMIVSVLLLLVMTNVGGVQKTVKDTANAGIIQTVESQMVIYEMKEGKKPTAKQLFDANYINEEQFTAYKAAPKKTKNPA